MRAYKLFMGPTVRQAQTLGERLRASRLWLPRDARSPSLGSEAAAAHLLPSTHHAVQRVGPRRNLATACPCPCWERCAALGATPHALGTESEGLRHS